jgi:predicted alpha/beta superfamily hydrolase
MIGIIKISVILMFFSVFIMPSLAQEANDGVKKGDDIVIGKFVTMKSNILKMPINLKISLPQGYEKSQKKYPVFYTLRDYFHITTGLLQPLGWQNSVPELIVVSVTNCRVDDFAPTKIEGRPTTGGADNLVKFMKKELIPFIDSHYRTQPYRIICSGSWSGMFCTYALLTAPDVFNAAIAWGPWLIYDNEKLIVLKDKKSFLKQGTYQDNFFMLKHTGAFLKEHTYHHNFLFFTGGDQPELTPSLEVFVQILKVHAPKELQWEYDPKPGQDHSSLAPFTIYDGLKRLYADWREVPEHVIMAGERELKKYIDTLTEKYGYDIGISKHSIRSYGWKYYQEEQFSKAIRVFQLNIVINPNWADAYYCLGKTYEAAGQLKQAKANYEKACKSNPSPTALKRYQQIIENLNKKMKTN